MDRTVRLRDPASGLAAPPRRADAFHTTFMFTERCNNDMDSDSPVNARTAGRSTSVFGVGFTAGNPRAAVTRTRRTPRGDDSARRSPGYRESPASHRLPVGQGLLP